MAIEAHEPWVTAYSIAHRGELFNQSGNGHARFSPLFTDDGVAIGSLYLARNPVCALLETVFHDVSPTDTRKVSISQDLAGRAMRRVVNTERLLLADLRDPALDRHDLVRGALVTAPAAHYACTREWADKLRTARPGGKPIAGLIWNSRVTEVAATLATPSVSMLLAPPLTEVCVIFGDHADELGFYQESIFDDLATGDGLTLVTDLAQQLGGYVE